MRRVTPHRSSREGYAAKVANDRALLTSLEGDTTATEFKAAEEMMEVDEMLMAAETASS